MLFTTLDHSEIISGKVIFRKKFHVRVFLKTVSLNVDAIILSLLHTFQKLGLELKPRQRHLPLQAINAR